MQRQPAARTTNIKRVMGEVRLSQHEIAQWCDAQGRIIRYGRNTLYRKLNAYGYVWSSKYSIWVKEA